MNKSDSIKELTAALAKAQQSFRPIKRTERVDYASAKGGRAYNYAPLNEVIEATRQALVDNGLTVMQPTKVADGKLFVETVLYHTSGEWISSEMFVGELNQPPQAEGSALTYKRRYSLSSLLCIASEEDDDARGATQETGKPAKAKPREMQKPTQPEFSTEAQRVKIFASGKERGYTEAEIHTIMETNFGKQHTKDLTKTEASQLIEMIEQGGELPKPLLASSEAEPPKEPVGAAAPAKEPGLLDPIWKAIYPALNTLAEARKIGWLWPDIKARMEKLGAKADSNYLKMFESLSEDAKREFAKAVQEAKNG